MKVKDLLKDSTGSFHSVEGKETVEEALKKMSAYAVSALVVNKETALPGIFTERDLVGKHVGALTRELHYLKDYISDLQDAAHD